MRFLICFLVFFVSTTCFGQQYYGGSGDPHYMAPVSAVGTLPATGNNVGDFRVETTAFNTYVWNGAAWACTSCAAGGGTVTSVSVAAANGFDGTVANATTTPAITIKTTVNGMTKGNGTALSAATSGTDYSAGTSALATGILKSTTATGVLSIAAAGTDYQAVIATEAGAAHNFLTSYNAGSFGKAQPACSDLSNGAASCSTDTTNAANISSGLLALARGGNHADLSATGGAHQVLRQSGAGADVTVSQLACSDLSNGVASCSTDTTDAANISSGLLALARGGTHADLSATGGAHQFLRQSGAGSDITVGQPAFSDVSGQLGTAQLPTSFDEVFIDYVSGNDANNGSVMAPWKTFAHTCATITPTINVPVVIHVTGGNNDSDGAPISCPPNINVVSDYGIQISQPFTITGGFLNDTVSFTNITHTSFTWIRNDASEISATFLNSSSNGLIDFEQQGAGVAASFLFMFQTGIGGGLTVQAGQTDIFSAGIVTGTINYKDSGNPSYLLVTGGDLFSAAFQLHGGISAYFSGAIADAGYSIVGTTTGSGTPSITSDSGSIPPPASITGAFTLSLTSLAPYVGYTPTTAGDWSSVPATVLSALDNLASTGVYKSQAANKFFASPNGAPGLMSPRSIVAADVPTLNQNTTGTAANLSGTPALPNGTTATTQAPGDNSTKLATTAYADAAAAGGGISSLTGPITATGPGAAATTINANVVANSMLAQMPTLTIKGNNTGGLANALDLTVAQVNTMIGTRTIGQGGTNSTTALNNNRVMQSSGGAIVEAAAITANRALISDANGIPTHSATTNTELGYVSGVTSAIQTQINAKGCKWNIVTKTANYTAVACDVILADATGGAFTITIPLSGSATTADEIKVKKIDSSANAVAVTASGADNVEYLATQSLSTQGDAVDLHPDGGTNWYAF